MGQINVEGVGVVDIKGDTPTFSEMADIKSRAEALKADNILTDEGDKEAQNFFTSPAFGRLVLEAGVSLGSNILTLEFILNPSFIICLIVVPNIGNKCMPVTTNCNFKFLSFWTNFKNQYSNP